MGGYFFLFAPHYIIYTLPSDCAIIGTESQFLLFPSDRYHDRLHHLQSSLSAPLPAFMCLAKFARLLY